MILPLCSETQNTKTQKTTKKEMFGWIWSGGDWRNKEEGDGDHNKRLPKLFMLLRHDLAQKKYTNAQKWQ